MIVNRLKQPKKGIKSYDSVKKVKGRKRHILVDNQGFLLATEVTSADTNDRIGLKDILDRLKNKFTHLKLIWADMGYLGKNTRVMVENYGRHLEIVKRPRKWFWVSADVNVNEYLESKGIDTSGGFKVQPKRWIVERTLAWLNKYRRLSKDYEYLTDTAEVTLLLAMCRTILRRLIKLIN